MSDSFSTILILALVALSEGVRRLTPGAFVLRRTFGRWSMAETLELGRELHLVAWAIPVSLPLVLPADASADRKRLGLRRLLKRLRDRARRVKLEVAILRVVGTIVLLGLVVGVPLATLRWDVYGLVLAIELLALFCVAQAIMLWNALRRSGVAPRAALATSLKALWPFTAPRAAEFVNDQVVRGVPPVAVAHELLGETRFLRELRPLVFDHVHADEPSEIASVLTQLCGADRLSAFLRERPADSGDEPFCPRCASQYRAEVTQCVNCEGVELCSSTEV
jgi:hypothetical protein